MGRNTLAVGLLVLASSPALAQAPLSRSQQPGYYTEDYPGAAVERADQKLPARIRVRLPADAEVLIDGRKTTSTGPVREYQTPMLDPERVYSYLVKARWIEDGITVEKSLRVRALSGNRVTINFLPPSQARPRPTFRVARAPEAARGEVPPPAAWTAPYP